MKRRDLDKDYVKTYKEKIKEVWRFVKDDNNSNDNTNYDVTDDEELNLQVNNDENEEDEEKTLDIPNKTSFPEDDD